MGLGILIFKFKYTFFIHIEYMGIQILVIPLVLSAIGHMDMTMKKIFRAVFLHQLPEYLESLVRQVPSVIELVCRGMGHQDINSFLPEQLEPQFLHALAHLLFCILVGAGFVAHGPPQPQNADSFIHKDLDRKSVG